MVIGRSSRLTNFFDYMDFKLVFKRYASLYFVTGVEKEDNELMTLEVMHHFVELLDRYFGNVCELDIIFNFHAAYFLLDEIIIGGHIQETSKKAVLKKIGQQDLLLDEQFFKDDDANKSKSKL
jgi:AP-1 complex subunit sigma 1/2